MAWVRPPGPVEGDDLIVSAKGLLRASLLGRGPRPLHHGRTTAFGCAIDILGFSRFLWQWSEVSDGYG